MGESPNRTVPGGRFPNEGCVGFEGEMWTFSVGDSRRTVNQHLARIEELREHKVELKEMRWASLSPTGIARHGCRTTERTTDALTPSTRWCLVMLV